LGAGRAGCHRRPLRHHARLRPDRLGVREPSPGGKRLTPWTTWLPFRPAPPVSFYSSPACAPLAERGRGGGGRVPADTRGVARPPGAAPPANPPHETAPSAP